MVYAWILRCQEVGEKKYYHVYDVVKAKAINNDFIQVVDGKMTKGMKVASYGSSNNAVYLIIDEETYLKTKNNSIPILLKEDEFDGVIEKEAQLVKAYENLQAKNPDNKNLAHFKLVQVEDSDEYNYVLSIFYLIYHDFYVNYPLDIINMSIDANDFIKEKVIGQDEPIEKIIRKIHNNFMFFKSDMTEDEMRKNKSNILLVGPRGTGKSTIVKNLALGFRDVPIINYTLVGDYEQDIINIFNRLMTAAEKNIFLAEQGIVVFDGITDEFSRTICNQDGDIDIKNEYISEIIKIINTRDVVLNSASQNSSINFNFSLITSICIVDMNYDYEDNYKSIDGLFYTKIRESKFYSYGFNDNDLIDCFSDEIIYMNPMTYDLAKEILLSSASPLLSVKKAIEKEFGRKVYFSKKFVSKLIEIGLEQEDGFQGIEKILRYVVDKKNLVADNIYFKVSDFTDLKIGSNVISDCESIADSISSSKTSSDIFQVDLAKKTINGMTVLDVVNKIKEKVIGQDDQIFKIVNAFFNHVLNRYKGFSDEEYRELKQNVLIIGGTGVGKTTIFESLAKIFDVPYSRESIKGYTPTGFQGPDVNGILRNLINKTNNNVERAKFAILGLDEFDKLANTTSASDGCRFGKEVQEELLTLMEGDIRHVSMSDNGYPPKTIDFDTSNLFIVLMGAFQGLEEISKRRVKALTGRDKAGFRTSDNLAVDVKPNKKDVIEYGIVDQLAARVPHVVSLNNLNEETLFKIIKNDKGYVALSLKSLSKGGVKVNMTDTFARKLASKALETKEGARGIKNVFEDIVTEIDRNNQEGDLLEVTLDEEAITDYSKINYVKRLGRKKD